MAPKNKNLLETFFKNSVVWSKNEKGDDIHPKYGNTKTLIDGIDFYLNFLPVFEKLLIHSEKRSFILAKITFCGDIPKKIRY